MATMKAGKLKAVPIKQFYEIDVDDLMDVSDEKEEEQEEDRLSNNEDDDYTTDSSIDDENLVFYSSEDEDDDDDVNEKSTNKNLRLVEIKTLDLVEFTPQTAVTSTNDTYKKMAPSFKSLQNRPLLPKFIPSVRTDLPEILAGKTHVMLGPIFVLVHPIYGPAPSELKDIDSYWCREVSALGHFPNMWPSSYQELMNDASNISKIAKARQNTAHLLRKQWLSMWYEKSVRQKLDDTNHAFLEDCYSIEMDSTYVSSSLDEERPSEFTNDTIHHLMSGATSYTESSSSVSTYPSNLKYSSSDMDKDARQKLGQSTNHSLESYLSFYKYLCQPPFQSTDFSQIAIGERTDSTNIKPRQRRSMTFSSTSQLSPLKSEALLHHPAVLLSIQNFLHFRYPNLNVIGGDNSSFSKHILVELIGVSTANDWRENSNDYSFDLARHKAFSEWVSCRKKELSSSSLSIKAAIYTIQQLTPPDHCNTNFKRATEFITPLNQYSLYDVPIVLKASVIRSDLTKNHKINNTKQGTFFTQEEYMKGVQDACVENVSSLILNTQLPPATMGFLDSNTTIYDPVYFHRDKLLLQEARRRLGFGSYGVTVLTRYRDLFERNSLNTNSRFVLPSRVNTFTIKWLLTHLHQECVLKNKLVKSGANQTLAYIPDFLGGIKKWQISSRRQKNGTRRNIIILNLIEQLKRAFKEQSSQQLAALFNKSYKLLELTVAQESLPKDCLEGLSSNIEDYVFEVDFKVVLKIQNHCILNMMNFNVIQSRREIALVQILCGNYAKVLTDAQRRLTKQLSRSFDKNIGFDNLTYESWLDGFRTHHTNVDRQVEIALDQNKHQFAIKVKCCREKIAAHKGLPSDAFIFTIRNATLVAHVCQIYEKLLASLPATAQTKDRHDLGIIKHKLRHDQLDSTFLLPVFGVSNDNNNILSIMPFMYYGSLASVQENMSKFVNNYEAAFDELTRRLFTNFSSPLKNGENLMEAIFALIEKSHNQMKQVISNDKKDNSSKDAKFLSLYEVLEVVRNICHALTYTHAMGVVHRDVNANNIMVSDSRQAYLGDFGLATIMNTPVETMYTSHESAPKFWFDYVLDSRNSSVASWHAYRDGLVDVYGLGYIINNLFHSGNSCFSRRDKAGIIGSFYNQAILERIISQEECESDDEAYENIIRLVSCPTTIYVGNEPILITSCPVSNALTSAILDTMNALANIMMSAHPFQRIIRHFENLKEGQASNLNDSSESYRTYEPLLTTVQASVELFQRCIIQEAKARFGEQNLIF